MRINVPATAPAGRRGARGGNSPPPLPDTRRRKKRTLPATGTARAPLGRCTRRGPQGIQRPGNHGRIVLDAPGAPTIPYAWVDKTPLHDTQTGTIRHSWAALDPWQTAHVQRGNTTAGADGRSPGGEDGEPSEPGSGNGQ